MTRNLVMEILSQDTDANHEFIFFSNLILDNSKLINPFLLMHLQLQGIEYGGSGVLLLYLPRILTFLN